MYENTYPSPGLGPQPNLYAPLSYDDSSRPSYGNPDGAGAGAGAPPPQSWNSRHAQQDRRDEHHFRGPYSNLRRSHPDDHRRDDGDHRNHDNYRPPQSDFTFRVERPAGIDSYRPSEREQRASRPYGDEHETRHHSRRDENNRPTGRDGRPRRNDDRRHQQQRPQRRIGPGQRHQRVKEKPSGRLLLLKKHDDQPELMLGDRTARATYRDIDELSDSDEAEMDISDNSDLDVAEPASKRARTSATTTKAEQDAPKWSNPDPYTALPPPDESSRKKKDMVQLIRKARVEAEAKKEDSQTEGLDFISCDFSDNEGDDGSSVAGKLRPSSNPALAKTTAVRPVPQAPTSITLGGAPATLPPKPSFSSSSPSLHQETRVQNANTPAHKPAGLDNKTAQNNKSGKKNKPIDLTASTSLGNRKRTFDDTIKQPHKSLKPSRKMTGQGGDGGIVPLWYPKEGEDPRPWVRNDHPEASSPALRLHNECMDFYEWARPRDFEDKVRDEMVTKLKKLIQKKWPDVNLYVFGSYPSKLYLPCADMDIAVCSKDFVDNGQPRYSKPTHLFALRNHLLWNQAADMNQVEVITRAKVPLVKFTDIQTYLKVDISFEKLDGYRAIKTFLEWKDKYPALPMLVAIIKQYLLMRCLNEPVNGGIGGFSTICLVVFILDQMPQIQSGSMKPEDHLGEVLLEFFDFFGNRFQYKTLAIRMNPPGLVPKNEVSNIVYRNMDRLSILDPNNPENDIAGGSKDTSRILYYFSRAHSTLLSRMMKFTGDDTWDDDKTILGSLLSGDYSNFCGEREWLQGLAMQGLKDYERKKYNIDDEW